MPFVSRPIILNGKEYLDGGVSDSIPFEKFMEMGYDRLIVVLTRDLTYTKKPMSKRLISIAYRKYPKFKEQLLQRHENYNASIRKLKKLEKEGMVYIVRPSEPIEIGRMEKNPEMLQKVYDLGVKDAKNEIKDIETFISNK